MAIGRLAILSGYVKVIVSGAPQEVVFAYASLETDFVEVPGSYGLRLLGEPGTLLGNATLSDAGTQVLHSLVPDLGPSAQGLPLHLQVVAVTPTGPVLGEAATVVVLDSAF